MKYRITAFGYQIRSGIIVAEPAEAHAVIRIYEMYINGIGYNTIAAKMETEGINYHDGSAVWNKHMVKRILENNNYTGGKGYPAIIPDELYAGVQAAKRANQHCKSPVRRQKDECPVSEESVSVQAVVMAIQRIQNEINRALEKPNIDTEHVKKLIFSCAAEKYKL